MATTHFDRDQRSGVLHMRSPVTARQHLATEKMYAMEKGTEIATPGRYRLIHRRRGGTSAPHAGCKGTVNETDVKL